MPLSLFSSAPWTIEQVNWVLRTHFNAEDDDFWANSRRYEYPRHPRGWMIPVAPGRRVTVEDGTEDIPGFPDVIMHRQRVLLQSEPVRRLSMIFEDGAVRGSGWNIDPERGGFQRTGYQVENPDLEWNCALWIGAVFARWWAVSWDDLAGDAWRPEPNINPSTLHALCATQPEPPKPRPRRWWQ
jgi:hypothetical protein